MSGLLSPRVISAILLTLVCPALQAQSQPDVSKYILHAVISREPNGDLRVEASSPWPLHQAISALIFQYGLLIDYEDPCYQDSQMYVGADGRKRLIGGQFVAVIPQITSRKSEATALQQLVKQFDEKGGAQFTLLQHSDRKRFDVVGKTGEEMPIFDTPIYLEKKSRTADEAVREIMSQIEQTRGISIVEGGIVNNALAQTKVTVGGPERKPAREFLTEVLNALPTESVWMLGYEPSWGKFVIVIQAPPKNLGNGGIQPVSK